MYRCQVDVPGTDARCHPQVSGSPALRSGAQVWVDLPPSGLALDPPPQARLGLNVTLTCRF